MHATIFSNSAQNVIIIYVIVNIVVIGAANHEQQSDGNDGLRPQLNRSHLPIPVVEDLNLYQAARKFILEGDTQTFAEQANNLVKSVPYIRSSIPMRIYECISEYSVLRCTKLYILQKMEESKQFPNSGNLSKDFLNQFFGQDDHIESLISNKFNKLSEKELNHRLVINFQRFFKNRDIKLHFLPGILVKVVPSNENKLQFSIKKGTKRYINHQGRSISRSEDIDENVSIADVESSAEGTLKKGGHAGGSGTGSKHKTKKPYSYKDAMIQMAVPVMVMPAILMGSFIPFVLPVLKMATIMTMMLNNSAFIAALIYAARTHANSQDEQPISYGYGHPSYH